MKKLVLIDGSSYIYRAFYALPPLTNSKGMPTGAIYGFVRMLLKLLKDLNPDYIAVVFDKSAKTFRQDIDKEYKATRKETPDELKVQIPKVKELIKDMGIEVLEKEGYEADDIIAYLAEKAKLEGYQVYIITPDKDMLQLVDENVVIYNPVSDKFFDREEVYKKYGVYPHQFVDYQAIVGDNVDNIKGVKGVGPKTAAKLLNEFDSLEGILANLDKLKPKQKEAFTEALNRLEKNKILVKLETKIDLPIDINQLKLKQPNWDKLLKELEELGFKKLLKEFEEKKEKDGTPKQQSLF